MAQIIAGGGRSTRCLKGPQVEILDRTNTYEEMLDQQQYETLELYFYAVFKIIQEDGVTTPRGEMNELYSIPLENTRGDPPPLLLRTPRGQYNETRTKEY